MEDDRWHAAACGLRRHVTTPASQESKLPELATERFRHVPGTGRGPVEVARDVLVPEIAPALERAPGSRLDQNELRLQHQMATADSALVHEWPHIEEPLPTHHLAADHPVERTAVAQLVGAFGHHPRLVHMLARKPALFTIPEFLADPVVEVFDRVTADAKLDEVKGHGVVPYVSRFGRSLSARWNSSPQRTCRHRIAGNCGGIATATTPRAGNHSKRAARVATWERCLSSEEVAYCGGASGVGGERAGAAPAAGLRADVPAAAPVVSCGGCGAAGSAVMMLTGGIEDADGK